MKNMIHVGIICALCMGAPHSQTYAQSVVHTPYAWQAGYTEILRAIENPAYGAQPGDVYTFDTFTNPLQDKYLREIFQRITPGILDKFSQPEELCSQVDLVKDERGDLKGVKVSINQTIGVTWTEKGKPTHVGDRTRKDVYAGVLMKPENITVYKLQEAKVTDLKNIPPLVLRLDTQGWRDSVYLVRLDQRMATPTNEFELKETIDLIRRTLHGPYGPSTFPDGEDNVRGKKFAYKPSRVVFPKINFDRDIDVRWMKGAQAHSTPLRERCAEITKARQHTKYKMDEEGALVETDFELEVGVMRGGDEGEDLTRIAWNYIVDGPFLIWFERHGLAEPYFYGFMDYDTWNKTAVSDAFAHHLFDMSTTMNLYDSSTIYKDLNEAWLEHPTASPAAAETKDDTDDAAAY